MNDSIRSAYSPAAMEKEAVNWAHEAVHSTYERAENIIHKPSLQAAAGIAVLAGAGLLFARGKGSDAEKLLPKAEDILGEGFADKAIAKSPVKELMDNPTGTRLGLDGLPRQLPGAHQLKLDAPPPIPFDASASHLHELSKTQPVADDLQWGKVVPSKRSMGIFHQTMEGVATHPNTSADTLATMADIKDLNLTAKTAIVRHPNVSESTIAKMLK